MVVCAESGSGSTVDVGGKGRTHRLELTFSPSRPHTPTTTRCLTRPHQTQHGPMTLYDILGVPPSASSSEIKTAWRELVLKVSQAKLTSLAGSLS